MRAAVSTYVEAFILIGVAVGGASLVFSAASPYASSAQGQSISLGVSTIRQGVYLAVERVALYNLGNAPISSFTILNEGVSGSAAECFALSVPPSSAVVATNCPPSGPGSNPLSVGYQIPSSGALLVELTLTGKAVTIGSTVGIVVTASTGAQVSAAILVTGA